MAELEKQSSDRSKQDDQRKKNLETCVTIEAEAEYWNYVRLNAKSLGDGKYNAPTYVWKDARQQKQDKIEECKLLYGN